MLKTRSFLSLILFFNTIFIFSQQQTKLWYLKPAKVWEEALPIGNGRIGAMLFGNTDKELIQLNESSLWSGGPYRDSTSANVYHYLQPIRDALSGNDFQKAMSLCTKMQGNFSESFLPLGDLEIKQIFADNDGVISNYKRELDLSTAIASTAFSRGDIAFYREAFISFPDSVMVIRYTADKQKAINLNVEISSLLHPSLSTLSSNTLVLTGKAPSRLDPSYYNKEGRNPVIWTDQEQCNGMRVQTVIKAVSSDGTVSTENNMLQIRNASDVILFLTASTSFNGPFKCPDKDGKDEKKLSFYTLQQASDKDYSTLKKNHIKDYQQYFGRVRLDLESDRKEPVEELPSNVRLQKYSEGASDIKLEELYFNFGRYLLIASSRKGGLPANLQGIWNKDFRPPWSSNYTININTQMNYWPAETGNLSEMHEPLLKFLKTLSVTGAGTASKYYHARGWVAHHNTDIWGLSNAVGNHGDGGPEWANWYMGGNWLAQHIWEHYRYTNDRKFLEEYYPVLRDAALFSIDWLIKKEGYLQTAPSTTPENLFWFDGQKVSVSESTTMDISIIRNLFRSTIEASKVLNTDTKLRAELQTKIAELYPYHIGREGQLLEWKKDYPEVDPKHRHLSHLFGLYPGIEISPIFSPELAKAAQKSFEQRGDEGTGWSKAWKINFAARLLDGNHAHKMIREILQYCDASSGNTCGGGTYLNFFDAHPPFQIDGNFGASAGMMEMLMQSQNNEIHLLPALPDAWPAGRIKGLKARGNFEVDIEWAHRQLVKASLLSVDGNDCVIRTQGPVSVNGARSKSVRTGSYYLTTFTTKKGKLYQIKAL